ncbi:universal stress protein [Streptomyces sp. NPDC086787]|uniref:universal stress protein n=1 Tax=Streptomyces sp. NPDC086787 TaxID=3365759 RepID=UPI003803AD9A
MITAPVIAAVDGSDDSLRALDWAVDAARRHAAPLRVVHARQYVPWAQPEVLIAGPREPDDDPVLDLVRHRLAGHTGDLAVDCVAPAGPPAVLLPELSSEAQLLVMGSRGRGGFASLLLGSNGMAAARDADCPVVVVPQPGREVHGEVPDGPGPRVVVGLSVDGPDEAALAFAFDEAALLGARVQVIAAYPWPVTGLGGPGALVPPGVDQDAIEEETRALAEGLLAPHRKANPDVLSEVHALPGDAAGRIVAASRDAELVVVGRHRRRLLAPARMTGSVTQAVLLHAASPVAVVPPSAEEK